MDLNGDLDEDDALQLALALSASAQEAAAVDSASGAVRVDAPAVVDLPSESGSEGPEDIDEEDTEAEQGEGEDEEEDEEEEEEAYVEEAYVPPDTRKRRRRQHSSDLSPGDSPPERRARTVDRPLAAESAEIQDIFRFNGRPSVRDRQKPLRVPRNLTRLQRDALYSARKTLFAVLCDVSEEPAGDFPKHPPPALSLERLEDVMRTCGVSASNEQLKLMVRVWGGCKCPAAAAEPRRRLCPQCYQGRLSSVVRTSDINASMTVAQVLRQVERLEREDEDLPPADLPPGDLPLDEDLRPVDVGGARNYHPETRATVVVDYEQFCFLFDDCELRVEKNGVVW